MKIKILTLGLVFLSSVSLIWAQPYEITEVDVFSLKKFLSPEIITVYGISIKNSLADGLASFGKTKDDIEIKGEYYFLNIRPGFKIRSTDKKTIDAIILTNEFKGVLKGETAKLFNLKTAEEVKNHLVKCLGNPDKHDPNRAMGMEFDIFIYVQGFTFFRQFDRESVSLMWEITTIENILKR